MQPRDRVVLMLTRNDLESTGLGVSNLLIVSIGQRMNLLIYHYFLASRRLRSLPNIKIQRLGTAILAWSLMLLPAADLGDRHIRQGGGASRAKFGENASVR
jgi:hypothetical protein